MRDCGLSDSGVRELADGLPVLRSLNLEHCTKARASALAHCFQAHSAASGGGLSGTWCSHSLPW